MLVTQGETDGYWCVSRGVGLGGELGAQFHNVRLGKMRVVKMV
jgi:hypothetical protein